MLICVQALLLLLNFVQVVDSGFLTGRDILLGLKGTSDQQGSSIGSSYKALSFSVFSPRTLGAFLSRIAQ